MATERTSGTQRYTDRGRGTRGRARPHDERARPRRRRRHRRRPRPDRHVRRGRRRRGGASARCSPTPRSSPRSAGSPRASRRVASVCSGAFVLAAAGLLDGRRATTHWSACDRLARRYPAVTVERDPIFVRDGNVYTSAGVTAGIDLCARARRGGPRPRPSRWRVARQLVVFLKRPGRPGAVQRHARHPDRRPRRRRRRPGLDRRPPRRRPLGAGARRHAPR